MKKLSVLLALALWAGVGCVTLPTLNDKPKPPAPTPPPAETKPVRKRPPVTADQVTDNNAHDKAKALLQELDREEETPPPEDTKPATKKK